MYFVRAQYLLLLIVSSYSYAQSSGNASSATFTVPARFPTALFSAYYVDPAPTIEPQPKIYDSVLDYTYPLELTSPLTIPKEDKDPVYYPQPVFATSNVTALVASSISQVQSIIADKSSSNCTKCIAAMKVGQYLAQRAPEIVPSVLVGLCEINNFHSNATCKITYEATGYGAIWTQVLALGDMGGVDGQYVCHSLSSTFCPAPKTIPSNTTALFKKPKPENATAPRPNGQRVKVLHMSDFHLDPRYDVGEEGNCSSGLCCRPSDSSSSKQTTMPAPLYGAFQCDTPYFLGTAALQSVGPLTGTSNQNSSGTGQFAWSIYTGDLVSHDAENQLSRSYTSYAESSVYHMLKYYIPSGPIFPVLGNHDSNPEAIDTTHKRPGLLGQQQSWNYQHVSSLWQQNSWISADAAAQARTHYAAYSINHPTFPKLRIITLNTDFWYRSNYLNFINTTNPDNSGNLAFLAQELQSAEDAGERVWILGHVLTGWDGTNPNPNPTDLFYQIVDRYSPHVIANVFFGHTHEDHFMIFYANNGTTRNAADALTTGWIGPSVTPLTNLNSGYRMYEVDTGDFNIYEAYTYYSDVSSFSALNVSEAGPVWQLEYSTRETYQPIGGWPSDAPLNATYWHLVTEAMLKNHTIASVQNTYQGKSSVMTPNCTSLACVEAKVCYMRSGSVALGQQCPQGFGSVQGKYTGKNF